MIEVLMYNHDKSNLLADAEMNLTVINKGRRKLIPKTNSTTPGVYKGQMELNFTGLSTFEFEVVTPNLKTKVLVDQEISDN